MFSKSFLFCKIFLCLSLYASPTLQGKVDFTNDVRPILSEYCFHCHGPDKSTREADLRLDLSKGAMKDLGGYSAVVPGKPEDSELVFRLHSDDKDELMPPPETGKRLNDKQKKILEEIPEYKWWWIDHSTLDAEKGKWIFESTIAQEIISDGGEAIVIKQKFDELEVAVRVQAFDPFLFTKEKDDNYKFEYYFSCGE